MGQQSINGLEFSEIVYQFGLNDPVESANPENAKFHEEIT
jgi:hypothetical protein